MRYADTCLLISLHVRDAGSDAALAWLHARGAETVLASQWGVVEFASALGILARRGAIDAGRHAAALERFRRFAAERLTFEPPLARDFERAAAWLERFESGLRAGDALHLAVCERRGAMLSTADDTLHAAAVALGVSAERVLPAVEVGRR